MTLFVAPVVYREMRELVAESGNQMQSLSTDPSKLGDARFATASGVDWTSPPAKLGSVA
jgi:hypothetical protein